MGSRHRQAGGGDLFRWLAVVICSPGAGQAQGGFKKHVFQKKFDCFEKGLGYMGADSAWVPGIGKLAVVICSDGSRW